MGVPPRGRPVAASTVTWLAEILESVFTVVRWLPTYDYRTNLLPDAIAAFTVTAVAAPEAVSYAAIAGLPPAQGLFTGFVAPLAYAAFGASPQLIVGPTAIMCILTDGAIPTTWGGAPVQPDADAAPTALRVQLAAALALAVALLQAAMAAARLGGVVRLISLPVVAGFTSGSALLTASSQAASLLGLRKCAPADGIGAGGAASCSALDEAVFIARHAGEIRWPVAGLSAAFVALLLAVKFGLPQVLPRRLRLLASLGPLALVALSAPLMSAFGPALEAAGVEPPKSIPAGLPQPSLPAFGGLSRGGSPSDWAALFVAAAPLAVIGFMGGVTIAATAARQAAGVGGAGAAADPGAELRGQAAANLACALGRGLPVTGSFSRTAVNATSGAVSGAAGVMAGGLMAVTLAVATGPLSLVPTPARAAVVVVAIAKMVEPGLAAALWRADAADAAVFVLTFAVVAATTAPTGLAVGVGAQWLVALTRGVLAPTPVEAWSWGAAEAGGVELEWRRCAAVVAPREPILRVGAAGDAGKLARSPQQRPDTAPPVAIVLRLAPDLQFLHGARLAAHVAEAAATYGPAALLLDCSAVAAVDGTGARALLGAVSDAAAGVGRPVVVAFGLTHRSAGALVATAAATAHAGGGGASATPPRPPPAAIAAAPGAASAGLLWVVRHAADAHRVAAAACLERLPGGRAGEELALGGAGSGEWVRVVAEVGAEAAENHGAAVTGDDAGGNGAAGGNGVARVTTVQPSRRAARAQCRRRARAPYLAVDPAAAAAGSRAARASVDSGGARDFGADAHSPRSSGGDGGGGGGGGAPWWATARHGSGADGTQRHRLLAGGDGGGDDDSDSDVSDGAAGAGSGCAACSGAGAAREFAALRAAFADDAPMLARAPATSGADGAAGVPPLPAVGAAAQPANVWAAGTEAGHQQM